MVAVPQTQFVEMTLVEGKTTKQEILDTLGTPESFSNTRFSYWFTGNLKAKLQIVQKDGTIMNVLLGDGEKFKTIAIHIDYKNMKTLAYVIVS